MVTEIGYGTDRSKRLQTISYKPLVELLNTSILFDVNAQGQGTLEEFICDRVTETFITNPDTLRLRPHPAAPPPGLLEHPFAGAAPGVPGAPLPPGPGGLGF